MSSRISVDEAGRLRVAIFSKIPVFPTHGGNRARLLSLSSGLKELGCEVSLFLIPSRQLESADFAAHHVFYGAGRFHVLQRGMIDAAVFNGRVLFFKLRYRLEQLTGIVGRPVENIDYLFPTGLLREVARIASLDRFDMVCVEYVHFSRLLDAFGPDVFKVLDTHDSFRAEFSARAEATGFRRAHRVLAMQAEEGELFRRQLEPDDTRVVVQSHLLDTEMSLNLGQTSGATFIGSSFEANRVSLRYFLDEVLPLILAEEPSFRLTVVGSICDDLEDDPQIVKLGRVPAVADGFRTAPILINPIRAGTGVKIKLLEAMGLGLPCVSTASGLRGLDASLRGGAIEVADQDASGFAEAVLRLYRDAGLRHRLGQGSSEAARLWNERQHRALMTLVEDGIAFRSQVRHAHAVSAAPAERQSVS